MKQYLELMERIVNEGEWVDNKRTNTRCLTVIGHQLKYDVGSGEFPLVTTRKSFWKSAIAEMIGYIRGYTSTADFRAIGAKTWDANANENEAWLNNPYRTGTDDMGMVYGAVGNSWAAHETRADILDREIKGDFSQNGLLSFKDIVRRLRERNDDRGLIWSFWNPAAFELGCLRPCMYEHQFSILGDKLYLNSTQRSCDVPLGLNFNMIQCYFLLWVVSELTGLKPAIATHNIINAHIYENQLEQVKEQLQRAPYSPPTFKLKDGVNLTLDYLLNKHNGLTPNDFEVIGYEYHPAISYPFTV